VVVGGLDPRIRLAYITRPFADRHRWRREGKASDLVDNDDQNRYYKRLDATAVAADAMLIDK
jgi:hypothetical protein